MSMGGFIFGLDKMFGIFFKSLVKSRIKEQRKLEKTAETLGAIAGTLLLLGILGIGILLHLRKPD